jgi:hypothetical protein
LQHALDARTRNGNAHLRRTRYLINMCRGRQVDVHAKLIAQCRFWPGLGVCSPRPRNTHECKRVLERLLEKSRYGDNASGLKSSCKMISTGNMRWISCMSSSARQAQPLERTRHAMRGPAVAESEPEAVQRPCSMHRQGWAAHLTARHCHLSDYTHIHIRTDIGGLNLRKN